MNKWSSQLKPEEATNFINAVEATSNVIRFHGHQVIMPQSVADHSARTAFLSFLLALEFSNGDREFANNVSVYGLHHDLLEGILKSDVPSPIKAKYGIRELIKKIELDVVGELFNSSSGNSNILRSLLLEVSEDVNVIKLVKVADLLDLGLYIRNEINLGNTTMLPMLVCFQNDTKWLQLKDWRLIHFLYFAQEQMMMVIECQY